MRKLILGAALLALATPVLAQNYDQYRNGGSSYDDRRDSYQDRRDDDRGYDRAGDRDGDGDYDSRDQYIARQGDDYRSYDRDRGDYRRAGYGLTPGRVLPRQYRVSWIANPWKYNLPASPRGAHWIIIRHDALLIRNNDQLILRVIRRSV